MYEGLESDCGSDPSLLAHLDDSRSKLKLFYQQNYANRLKPSNLRPSQSLSSISSRSSISGSPERVNFTSRYQMHDRIMVDEFEEYSKLPREDFDSCKPLQWWLGRRSQFPNLYRLVCDLFSIPGRFPSLMMILSIEMMVSRLRSCRRAYFFGWQGYHFSAPRKLGSGVNSSAYAGKTEA
jgi:hypothetical protein